MSKILIKRSVVEQALEAMEYSGMDVGKFNRVNAACAGLRTAVRAALEQPEQEPVAWAEEIIADLHALHNSELIHEADSGDALIRLEAAIATIEEAAQRYTAPTQRKPVELLDEELEPLLDAVESYDVKLDDLVKFARAVIAAYEAKNGITREGAA